MARPGDTLRIAQCLECRYGPLVPGRRRVPLPAGARQLPEKGTSGCGATHIACLLAELERAKQEVLASRGLTASDGQDAASEQRGCQGVRLHVAARRRFVRLSADRGEGPADQ